jgi:hypothetical protein
MSEKSSEMEEVNVDQNLVDCILNPKSKEFEIKNLQIAIQRIQQKKFDLKHKEEYFRKLIQKISKKTFFQFSSKKNKIQQRNF